MQDASAAGYVYLSRTGVDHFSGPDAAGIVECSSPPPWIVLHESLGSVLLTEWPPGALWKAVALLSRNVDERAELQRLNATFRPDAGHVRVSSVRVVEELQIDLLFGECGAAVTEVVDYASRITRRQAEKLSEERPDENDEVIAEVWQRFLTHTRDRTQEPAVWSSDFRSPIGPALNLIPSLVWDRAVEAEGSLAFIAVGEDNDGPEEDLVAPWSRASAALVEAAIAAGAPELAGSSQAALSASWDMRLV
jgi:hypothetical protein